MAETGHLAGDAAQAKARGGRIIGHFQAAIVKAETFAGAILQVEFAIVARLQGITGDAERAIGIEKAGLVEKAARI